MEYVHWLKGQADALQGELLIVMRTYFEKPRTTVGWKGYINDPHMDGSFSINEGLTLARTLLLEIVGLGLAVGTEFLDLLSPQYISDLVTWGAIGARTILNPAPVFDLDTSLLSLVDVLIPNEHEAAQLTGLPTDSTVDATEAAQALVSDGVGCVVITRGRRGSVWANAQGSGSFGVFDVTPIDTVAAGDAFCGGFAAALAEGREFIEALRWASAAGALSTTVRGAVPSLPRRAAVEELVAQA
jgi:sugar/nucleoside kinase (ribokinase family)